MSVCKKKYSVLALSFCLLSIHYFYGQKQTQLPNLIQDLENLFSKQPSEKTYLHTDKDIYATEETIWLKLYLLNGNSYLNSEKSQVVYIELLDDKDALILQKKAYVENIGALCQIDLNSTMGPGNYTIRAYTRYMLNKKKPVVFEKKITLFKKRMELKKPNQILNEYSVSTRKKLSLTDSLKIAFFPEGGNLVHGIETFVGLKVSDQTGKGISKEGKIIDEQNNIISFFKSQEFGVGKFKIVPRIGSQYFALIADSLKFPLPEIISKGYVLNATNKGEVIVIDISTNISKGLEGAYILGNLRGEVIFNQQLLASTKNSYRIRFLTEGLLDGVAQFTLFKADGKPLCKRLMYINRSDNDIKLTLDSDRSFYNLREKVSLKLNLVDSKEKPIGAMMSLAVTSAERLNLTTQSSSIESWLSLNSDMESLIANPGFFFKENSFRKNYLLDIIMIANDWRNFSWEKINKAIKHQELNNIPEKGIMIKGNVVDFKTKTLPKEANITLNLLGSADGPYSEEQLTDANGEFNFGPYVFIDTLKAILNAKSLEKRKNGKSKKLAILLQDNLDFKREILKKKRKNIFVLQEETNLSAIPLSTRSKNPNFQFEEGTIELDEAEVVEKKKTRQDSINIAFKKLSPLYSNPTHRIFMDSLPNANAVEVFDVFRRYPGARIVGSAAEPTVLLRLRYGGNPLFVVDGVITTPDVVQYMNPAEIEFIDVLDQSTAGAYVSGAANGVVVVYTKGSLNLPTKNKRKQVANVNGVELMGFSKTREFPVTDYSNEKIQNMGIDNRSTLYWKPDLWLDDTANGNIDISFFTNDLPGYYSIKVEGISMDGRPISTSKVIEVRKE